MLIGEVVESQKVSLVFILSISQHQYDEPDHRNKNRNDQANHTDTNILLKSMLIGEVL
jgi:hypothetical protein